MSLKQFFASVPLALGIASLVHAQDVNSTPYFTSTPRVSSPWLQDPKPAEVTDVLNLAQPDVPGGDAAKVEADAGDSEDLNLDALDERLKEIEDSLKAEAEAAKEAKEEAEKEAKKYKAPSKPSWSWTGRVHADYWGYPQDSDGIGFFEHPDPTDPNFGTDPENRFAFRRLRLGMKGDVLETMLYKLEVDYNNPGRPEYKDIYLGWKELPYNQTLLLGNQKRPLGMDHLNSSRYNVFMERPLVVEAFNEDARRIGLAAYGFTDNELFHWRYGVYNLENTSTDGRFIGDSLQLSANARLSSSPWYDYSSGGRGYLHWAVAGMYAKPDGDRFAGDTNNNDGRFRTRGENRSDQRWLNTGRIAGIDGYEILAGELAVNVGAFQMVSEFQANWTQREGASDVFFHGGYVQASYFLTGEFQPYDRTKGIIGRVKPYQNFFLVDRCKGGRGSSWGAWQIAARFSYLDLTDDDIRGGIGTNFTAGLNWFWTAYSKVQVNYIYGDITDHADVGGFTDGTYNVVGTRFMVDF